MERDEQRIVLEKEKDKLKTELPELNENYMKLTKQLDVEKKEKAQKESWVSRAMKITELRVAEAMKSDYAFLSDNPELI